MWQPWTFFGKFWHPSYPQLWRPIIAVKDPKIANWCDNPWTFCGKFWHPHMTHHDWKSLRRVNLQFNFCPKAKMYKMAIDLVSLLLQWNQSVIFGQRQKWTRRQVACQSLPKVKLEWFFPQYQNAKEGISLCQCFPKVKLKWNFCPKTKMLKKRHDFVNLCLKWN